MREILIAPRLGFQVAVVLTLAYAAYHFWPSYGAPWTSYVLAVILIAVAFYRSFPMLLEAVKYHEQVGRKRRFNKPPPDESDARFTTEQEMEAAGLFEPNSGVPFGMYNGRPLFYPFTHAFICAPAGTSKTIAGALPAIVHGYRVGSDKQGSSASSAIVTDLKREIYPMTNRVRQELHGHEVIVLDPAKADTAAYNALVMVIDAVQGRIPPEKALSLLGMVSLALELEPSDDGKNKMWRDGARSVIDFPNLYLCLYCPERATLATTSLMVRDPDTLNEALQFAATIEPATTLERELATVARDLLKSPYLDQFRASASLALKPFSDAGELHRVTERSTFRWADLKRKKMTVYLCANLAESKVYAPWLRLLAECATMELEYAQGNIPVHLLLDEATNIAFDISSKLTALRASGVRVHFFCQEMADVERVFGKHAAETIPGESNLRQYFSVNDQNLAKKLSEEIGTRKVNKNTYSRGANPWDAYSETSINGSEPLMSAAQIRNMPPNEQLVFIKDGKHVIRPIRCQKMPYSQVKEWGNLLDDNPIEGGKLKGSPTIRIRYTREGVRVTRCKKRNRRLMRRLGRFLYALTPPLYAGFAALWLALAYSAWLYLLPESVHQSVGSLLNVASTSSQNLR